MNEMKKFKCFNCARNTEVMGDTVMVMCGCGYEMVEQIPDKKKNKNI